MDYPYGKFGLIVVSVVLVLSCGHTHTDADERLTLTTLVGASNQNYTSSSSDIVAFIPLVTSINAQLSDGMHTLDLFADSFVQETTRLSSGVFMVRYVTEDTNFETESGQKFLIREGDRIAIYPPALHKDPEIFEDPMVSSRVVSVHYDGKILTD